MKNLAKLIPVILVLFVISCTAKKAASDETISAAAFTAVDVETYKSLIAGNGALVDVRTPAEFAEGKIKGAINVDWRADDFESKIQALDKETPVYIYCTAGEERSIGATEKMKDLGFKEVYYLEGGFVAWNKK